MKMRQTFAIAVGLLLAAVVGCAISGKLPAPVEPVASGVFSAWAARTDITPMPGYPMGGYAIAGYMSRGVWMRLYARAIVFEDADGAALALVSTDLWAMPAGLTDRVADLVARTYGIRELAREQIIVAATHTHNGPGNFSSSKLYNQMASPEGGFDDDLFGFLAERIAGVIVEAWEARRPAALRYAEAPVPGLARNRSLGPFLANGPDALALIEENQHLPIRRTPFPVGGDRAYRAVDQTLRVIRVEAGGSDPSILAALAFYAVHPTVMNTPTEVYNSDIFGVATSKAESSLSDGTASPVVAIFNGPEGDVAANWTRRDRSDAIELGTILADSLISLIGERGEDVTGAIAFNVGETDLSDLAGPLSGASMLCGAEGDWSVFRDAGFYEGMTQPDPEKQLEGQGVKRHPLEDDTRSKKLKNLYPWIVDKILDPPDRAPLGVYRIGPVVIGTLPGEFTTILGRRIRNGIARELPAAEHVLLVGLANEYVSYFTTEEEYQLQHYEGASMLYGPLAGSRIGAKLATLAAALGSSQRRDKQRRYRYSTGSREHFGVWEFDFRTHQDRMKANHYNLATVLMNADNGLPVTDHPRFIWIDENPEWARHSERQKPVMPPVSIEVEGEAGWVPLEVDGRPENDQGTNFVTTIVASLLGKTRWTTTWMPPGIVEEDPTLQNTRFRFVVQGTNGLFRSSPFTMASASSLGGLVGIARKPERQ